jgi:phosphopantothenoylcysteine decarboxylase/phosphopantothenate--cysteine ligase
MSPVSKNQPSSHPAIQPTKKRLRILITAGPTREKIDPVRFISNYSTGVMGYEIAKRARSRGHSVVLVSGPVALKCPAGIRIIAAESAVDMRRAVLKELPGCDVLIMAAAVCDWAPEKAARRKLKKVQGSRFKVQGPGGKKRLVLRLVENPDILLEAGGRAERRLLIGFALETEELLKNAREKLRKKNLDAIVANRTSPARSVFGDRKADFLILDRRGVVSKYRNISKKDLAGRVIDKAEALWYIND